MHHRSVSELESLLLSLPLSSVHVPVTGLVRVVNVLMGAGSSRSSSLSPAPCDVSGSGSVFDLGRRKEEYHVMRQWRIQPSIWGHTCHSTAGNRSLKDYHASRQARKVTSAITKQPVQCKIKIKNKKHVVKIVHVLLTEGLKTIKFTVGSILIIDPTSNCPPLSIHPCPTSKLALL